MYYEGDSPKGERRKAKKQRGKVPRLGEFLEINGRRCNGYWLLSALWGETSLLRRLPE